MSKIKVGDKVRLTGKDWETEYSFAPRTVVTVDEIAGNGDIYAGEAGTVGRNGELHSTYNPDWSGDYSCELVVSSALEEEPPLQDLEKALLSTPFEQSVNRITSDIAKLLIRKNKQYSNSALDPIRVFSKADRMEQLRVRADDKLSRIRNGDSSEDAVMDLAGYLVLMKIAQESE